MSHKKCISPLFGELPNCFLSIVTYNIHLYKEKLLTPNQWTTAHKRNNYKIVKKYKTYSYKASSYVPCGASLHVCTNINNQSLKHKRETLLKKQNQSKLINFRSIMWREWSWWWQCWTFWWSYKLNSTESWVCQH